MTITIQLFIKLEYDLKGRQEVYALINALSCFCFNYIYTLGVSYFP